MGNFKDAWTDVKGLIDRGYPTEGIELARIATEHQLPDKDYYRLIGKAELYHKSLHIA